MVDQVARKRRALRARDKRKHHVVNRPLLSVFRTSQHMYAQIRLKRAGGEVVVASASTLDSDVKQQLSGYSGNRAAATLVGQIVAKRAKEAGVVKVACDRSGFKYHGRVKSLVDAARSEGLEV